jgi:hypothetical protein
MSGSARLRCSCGILAPAGARGTVPRPQAAKSLPEPRARPLERLRSRAGRIPGPHARPTGITRKVTGCRQIDFGISTQSNLHRPTLDAASERPRLRASLLHDQVKAVSVGDLLPDGGWFELADGFGGQHELRRWGNRGKQFGPLRREHQGYWRVSENRRNPIRTGISLAWIVIYS